MTGKTVDDAAPESPSPESPELTSPADFSARYSVPGTVVSTPGIQFQFPQNGVTGPGPQLGNPQAAPFPAQQQIVLQAMQSPFPPPEHVRQYEAIMPGAFNRIMLMTERAQAAQIESMDRAMTLEHRDNTLMRILGTLVTLAAIGGAVFLD